MGLTSGHDATIRRFAARIAACLLAGVFLATGCSKPPEKDPFFDHWQEKADASQGYSPSAGPKNLNAQAKPIESSQRPRIPETALNAKPVVMDLGKEEKKLPTTRVSLKMYNTDIIAVLRALARAANQNIVVSSTLRPVEPKPQGALGILQGQDGQGGGQDGQGEARNDKSEKQQNKDDKTRSILVNINIADAPWNQAFESILHANGLSYTWEGDIIRVVTFEDLENDRKMKEQQEKILVQKEKLKMADELLTRKVEINYADIGDVLETVKAYINPVVKRKSKDGLAELISVIAAINSGGGSNDDSDDDSSSKGKNSSSSTSNSSSNNSNNSDAKIEDNRPGKVRGFVVADYHTNSLVIQASREDMEKLLRLIQEIDEPRPQVVVKAFIIETTKDVARELGVQWGGKLKSGSGNTPFTMSPAGYGVISQKVTTGELVQNFLPYYGTSPGGQGFGISFPTSSALTSAAATAKSAGLGGSGMGLNFLFGNLDGNSLEAQLTALAENGKVNILSNPSLTTLENRVAYTWNGRQIPYVSSSQYGTNVQFRNAVLLLGMIPHIIDGNSLRMDILVKNDEVDNNQNNWVQGNPPLITKETRTTLIVEDGDTIVISGLTKDTVADSSSGIPYLKDIPGLGYLFKTKSDAVAKQEVLIFITPKVLPAKPLAMAGKPRVTPMDSDSVVQPSDGLNLELRPGF